MCAARHVTKGFLFSVTYGSFAASHDLHLLIATIRQAGEVIRELGIRVDPQISVNNKPRRSRAAQRT